jgi:hypothetical protein
LRNLKINDTVNGIDEKYTLLEVSFIDGYVNKDKNSIIIHNDPNFNGGFYTYDNISPKSIKIIKDDL